MEWNDKAAIPCLRHIHLSRTSKKRQKPFELHAFAVCFLNYRILAGKPIFLCTFVSVRSASLLAFSAPLRIISSR